MVKDDDEYKIELKKDVIINANIYSKDKNLVFDVDKNTIINGLIYTPGSEIKF